MEENDWLREEAYIISPQNLVATKRVQTYRHASPSEIANMGICVCMYVRTMVTEINMYVCSMYDGSIGPLNRAIPQFNN
jgi:hypothetical protein